MHEPIAANSNTGGAPASSGASAQPGAAATIRPRRVNAPTRPSTMWPTRTSLEAVLRRAAPWRSDCQSSDALCGLKPDCRQRALHRPRLAALQPSASPSIRTWCATIPFRFSRRPANETHPSRAGAASSSATPPAPRRRAQREPSGPAARIAAGTGWLSIGSAKRPVVQPRLQHAAKLQIRQWCRTLSTVRHRARRRASAIRIRQALAPRQPVGPQPSNSGSTPLARCPRHQRHLRCVLPLSVFHPPLMRSKRGHAYTRMKHGLKGSHAPTRRRRAGRSEPRPI